MPAAWQALAIAPSQSFDVETNPSFTTVAAMFDELTETGVNRTDLTFVLPSVSAVMPLTRPPAA